MDKRSVSVVIPVKNGAAFIGEAVASALAQDRGVVTEVIVVDDGSTDGTATILAAIADERLQVLANPGRGVSSARNHGAAQARSHWLHFLDADDRLLPGAVAMLVERAEHDTLVAYGDYDRIDAKGRRVGLRHLARRRPKPSGDVLEAVLSKNIIVVGCAVIRRDAFDSVGGFDPSVRLCEDWLLWCRLAVMGPFAYAPGLHVVDYRMHEESTMHRRVRRFAEFETVLDRIHEQEAIRRHIAPQKLAALRAAGEASLRSYVTTEAARAGDWRVAGSELLAAMRQSPSRAPTLTLRLVASVAGF